MQAETQLQKKKYIINSHQIIFILTLKSIFMFFATDFDVYYKKNIRMTILIFSNLFDIN